MLASSVIVYRSRFEQERDEFWYGLLSDYPWFFPSLFGGILVFILLVWLITSIPRRGVKRNHSRPPGRYWR